MGIWSQLDELGSSLIGNASKIIDAAVTAKIAATPPAVATAPNATQARDTSAAGKASDPNGNQKLLLWGALGLAAVTLVFLITRRS
jgi:hypothetical protein